jgi:DNA-binding NtrC family response regulator
MGAKADRRKPNFEIVPRPDLPREDVPRRILSVSYDESLARTRDMIFSAAGLEVITFTDIGRAVLACHDEDFDLVVIGHSIPAGDRKHLLDEVHTRCSAPVLALHRHGDSPLPGADYVFDASQSPDQLLETVLRILKK